MIEQNYLPQKDRDKDQFEYEEFSSSLAIALASIKDPIGYVVSIEGPWGSGKSTCLEYLRHDLKSYPEIIEVPYNPWMLSGTEQVVEGLLCALINGAARLGSKETNAVIEKLSKLAMPIAKLYGEIGPDPISRGLAKAASSIDIISKLDLVQLKADAALALQSKEIMNKRIVVTIDDIDRLSPSEIRCLFSAIKSALDLPNILFVTVFDRKVVSKALEVKDVIRGRDYLEKIIQAPFNLPHPSTYTLVHTLIEGLLNIFDNSFVDDLEGDRFWKLFHTCLSQYLRTPRNIFRLLNVLRLTYPAVKQEVCHVDFIAIETLRVFNPGFYQAIRENSNLVLSKELDMPSGEFASRIFSLAEESSPSLSGNPLISHLTDSDLTPEVKLLTLLFPQIYKNLFSNQIQRRLKQSPVSENWYKELRICDPDRFWSYFLVQDKKRRMSNSEYNDLLCSLKVNDSIEQRLIELSKQFSVSGYTRAVFFFERLSKAEQAVNEKMAIDLLEIIFKHADQFWQEDTFAALIDARAIQSNKEAEISRTRASSKAGFLAGRIISKLAMQLSEEGSILLKNLIENKSTSIWCSCLTTRFIRDFTTNSYPESYYDSIEFAFVQRMKSPEQQDKILESRFMAEIIYSWTNLDSEGQAYMERLLETPEHFSKLLEAVTFVLQQNSEEEEFSPIMYDLDTSLIGELVTEREFLAAVRQHKSRLFLNRQTQIAVRNYLSKNRPKFVF